MSNYSLPQCAPLFPAPPYHYENYRKLSAICRTDMDAIAALLPAPLNPVSDIVEVFTMDVPDAGALGSYREGGLTVQVEYNGQIGGHVLFEYVTTDDSLVAGREIWGYPKKLCALDWIEESGKITSRLVRRNTSLITMDFEPDAEKSFEPPLLQPRFQVKLIPSANGAEPDVNRVIRNMLAGGTVHQHIVGTANVTLGGSAQDPLNTLPILEVLGAEFIVADFVLGYGQVL